MWRTFGTSVAVSSDGNVVVAGAPFGEYVDVHHYDEMRDDPTRIARLTGEVGSEFGFSVAASADAASLIVGAPWTGTAYVYALSLDNESSSLLQRLDSDQPYDIFGRSVAA